MARPRGDGVKRGRKRLADGALAEYSDPANGPSARTRSQLVEAGHESERAGDFVHDDDGRWFGLRPATAHLAYDFNSVCKQLEGVMYFPEIIRQ